MLHRFTDPATGTVGHEPAALRQTLSFLRRRGYELVELGEMFRRLPEDERPGDLGVAFTLDDGYADQVRVAGPVFAEFDCPATVFVTTGFLDQQLWFWWDRIEYVFDHARRSEVAATHRRPRPSSIGGTDPRARAALAVDFIARCKLVPDDEKHAAIDRLAERAEVTLPAAGPVTVRPDDLGGAARLGATGHHASGLTR